MWVLGCCLTTSCGTLQAAEPKFTSVSRPDQGNFSTKPSSLLPLPASPPASHTVPTSPEAPRANSEQQEYLSQVHFSTFLPMEMQLLIIFANPSLHLKPQAALREVSFVSHFPIPVQYFSHLHTRQIKSSLSPRIASRTTAFASF